VVSRAGDLWARNRSLGLKCIRAGGRSPLSGCSCCVAGSSFPRQAADFFGDRHPASRCSRSGGRFHRCCNRVVSAGKRGTDRGCSDTARRVRARLPVQRDSPDSRHGIEGTDLSSDQGGDGGRDNVLSNVDVDPPIRPAWPREHPQCSGAYAPPGGCHEDGIHGARRGPWQGNCHWDAGCGSARNTDKGRSDTRAVQGARSSWICESDDELPA